LCGVSSEHAIFPLFFLALLSLEQSIPSRSHPLLLPLVLGVSGSLVADSPLPIFEGLEQILRIMLVQYFAGRWELVTDGRLKLSIWGGVGGIGLMGCSLGFFEGGVDALA
jgi:hypothetical protein